MTDQLDQLKAALADRYAIEREWRRRNGASLVAPDDQPFLMIRRNIQAEGEPILVQNFFEALKEKVK